MRNIKICFAASSGGHLEQLVALKPLMREYDSILITEKTEYIPKTDYVKTYYLKQINRRELLVIPKLIINAFISLWILLKERPNIIITTGVLSVIPLCLLVKIFGGKLIFIESFAKIHSPTRTGKLLYHFADRFVVQWEEMQKIYPDSLYFGSIY